MTGQRFYPELMTESIEQVLSQMCFEFIHLANLWRETGDEIPRRAESEQAYFLHWSLKLALDHGANWRRKGAEEIERRLNILRSRKAKEIANGE